MRYGNEKGCPILTGPNASVPTAPIIFTPREMGWGPEVEEGFGRERRAVATALWRGELMWWEDVCLNSLVCAFSSWAG